MPAVDNVATLEALLRARAPAAGMAWLDGAFTGAVDVRVAFPAVGRHLGRGGLDAPGAELAAGADRVPLAAWRIDDAGRAFLLLGAARRDPGVALALANQLYFDGDARERTGALRAMSLLPDGDAGLPAVLDAMRISQGEIFEAGMLDNPYTSRHLPQHEWRKAVLKCLFLGQALERIVRLDERADAELGQSLLDYAREREAASRAVPAALWPVAALHPPPGLAAKLLGYLEHPAVEQRAAAAVALGRLRDPRTTPFLADHAARETDPTVQAALQKAL